MSDLIKIFSNRELSLIIWLSFFIVLILFSKKIRNSLFSVVSSLFNKSFLFLYLWVILYMILIITPLYLLDLWRVSDFKNTSSFTTLIYDSHANSEDGGWLRISTENTTKSFFNGTPVMSL